MLPDYHIHTARCGHAEGTTTAYVEAAIRKGIKEIGFADHIPLYWLDNAERDPELAMPEAELPHYVAEIHELQKTYPQITIRLGIEVDYIPGAEDDARAIIEEYPFDYVLGSIHYIDGWGFDNPDFISGYEGKDPDEVYRCYFDLLQRAASSGLFDILAHPDLIKKFNYRSRTDLRPLYQETARVIARAGTCIEINTAGLRKPVQEIYPSLEFLTICRSHGIPVTVGSDAHSPEEVGADFGRAAALVREAGYRQIVTFSRRRRTAMLLKVGD
ncbi:MAG: histidinol-phosphatase HisJ family protein [Peptococcaceae bacterium]|nr:histidinol-phosphatase HisJ family protein [Peptococcaceae bacterium]